MQQQALQNSGETRLTEREANLIVTLHSEREQKDGVTTLSDLAETLHISLAEADRLLTEVRSIPDANETPVEVRPAKTSPWGTNPALTKVLLALVVLACLGFAAHAAFVQPSPVESVPMSATASMPPRMVLAAPARIAASEPAGGEKGSVALAPDITADLTFHQTAHDGYAARVRLPSGYVERVLSGADSGSAHRSAVADSQEMLTDGIFKCVEYVADHRPDNGYFNLVINVSGGSWNFDVPVHEPTGSKPWTENLKARNAIRDQIASTVQQNWEKVQG